MEDFVKKYEEPKIYLFFVLFVSPLLLISHNFFFILANIVKISYNLLSTVHVIFFLKADVQSYVD